MRSFWTYISNGEYSVGCTGQTVYLYDKQGTELAAFKDMSHAYDAAFSPKGDIFVVKSNDGKLAVYSPESLSLIKKFRFAKEEPQDQGFSFSPDGELFYILEYSKQSLNIITTLAIYRTSDFTLEKRLTFSYRYWFNHIECDPSGRIFLIGADRRAKENDQIVARLCGDEVQDAYPLTDNEYWFYMGYLSLAQRGFTKKKKETLFTLELMYGFDFQGAENWKHSLAKLWEYKHSKK